MTIIEGEGRESRREGGKAASYRRQGPREGHREGRGGSLQVTSVTLITPVTSLGKEGAVTSRVCNQLETERVKSYRRVELVGCE